MNSVLVASTDWNYVLKLVLGSVLAGGVAVGVVTAVMSRIPEEWVSLRFRRLIAILAIAVIFVIIRPYTFAALGVKESNGYQVAARFSETSRWRSFGYPQQQFEALFPTLPKYTHDEKQGSGMSISQDSYTCGDSLDSHLAVTVVRFSDSSSTAEPEAMLDGWSNFLAHSDPHILIVSMDTETVQNCPARTFVLRNDSIGYEARERTLIREQMMYSLMYVYKAGEFDQEVYKRFMDGFKLLPQTP